MTARSDHRGLAGGARVAGILLVLTSCIMFGGGELSNAYTTSICLLVAIGLLAAELWTSAPESNSPQSGLYLLAAALAIPILQLIPLPPAVWHSLPGRDLLQATLSAAGLSQDGYRPLTFDSTATLDSALCLLPAIAVTVATNRLDMPGRSTLLKAIIAIGILSIFFSVLGDAHLIDRHPDETARSGILNGFFYNQNHEADLLLISLICSVFVQAETHFRSRNLNIICFSVILLFIISVFATGSRMGVILLVLTMIACLALGLREKPRLANGKAIMTTVAVLGVAVILWALLPLLLPRLLTQIETQVIDLLRISIWNDSIFVAERYLPFGSGMGTFQLVYNANEPLDKLSDVYINHAHNDYLEILIESGFLGGGLLLAGFVWFFIRSFSAWRHGTVMARTASIALGVYALHSTVDYPLRSLGHAALAGVFIALLGTKEQRARARIPVENSGSASLKRERTSY